MARNSLDSSSGPWIVPKPGAAAAEAAARVALLEERQAMCDEYRVKKARAIEEAWAQKARSAGKLTPSRSIALKQNRTHDLRFDDQPEFVQEAYLAATAHDNAFDPDSQVIQMALRTKRALAEGKEDTLNEEEKVVGVGSVLPLAKRTAFPTHKGDFVWSLADESKQVREDLENPGGKVKKDKKAEKKAKKAEKKEKKREKEKRREKLAKEKKKAAKKLQMRRKRKWPQTEEDKLALQMQKEEQMERKKLKTAQQDVRKIEKQLQKLNRARSSSSSSSGSSSSSSS